MSEACEHRAPALTWRDDHGYHSPAPGRRLRANLVDVAIGIIGGGIVTLTIVGFP